MLRFLFLNIFNQIAVAAFTPYTQLLFRNKGFSHSLVGVIVAVGMVASIFIPIIIGIISDRTRKTRMIGVAVVVAFVLSYIPSALSGSVAVSLVCYFLASGLFWALNPMFDGYMNRVLAGDSSKYGLARSIGTMGYLLFLVFCGVSGIPNESDNWSITLVMMVSAALLIAACLAAPKDIPLTEAEMARPKQKLLDFSCFSKKFYLMMFIVGLTRISQSLIDRLLSAYMTEVLDLGSRFALFYALGAFCEFLMILFGGRLLQKGKVSAFGLIVLSCVGMFARLMIYFFSTGIVAFAIAQTFHAFTFGALHIGTTRFIAENVDEDHYSLGMSFYWSIATNLPATIGIIAGGFIIDNLGYHSLFGIYSIFPVIAFVMLYVFKRYLTSSVKPVCAVKEA